MKLRFLFVALVFGALACKEVPPGIDPTQPEPTLGYDFLLQGLTDSLLVDAGIPGLALGIVEGENLTYESYSGVLAMNGEDAVSRETRFTSGPLSDMITTMAVLQLVDDSLLDLDTHVGEYLDWEFAHPQFPQANITLRMLLSHTAGVRDDSALLGTLITPGDAADDLNGFLSAYFEPGGGLYSPAHFLTERPGKERRYSAVGITLAAGVVESVVGIPYSIWCETNLFAKLAFGSDGWFLDNIASSNVALPHVPVGNMLVQQPAYGYPAYPGGLLRMNLRAASRMWRALAQRGAYGGQRFFGAEEFKALTSIPFPFADDMQALGWKKVDLAGLSVWKAGGNSLGYTSVAYFNPANLSGVILLANGGGFEDELETLALTALNAVVALQGQ